MRKDFDPTWFYLLPVLIIGTYDENGKPDAMNAAWGGLYDTNLVELCLSAGHKTTKNILQKKHSPSALPTPRMWPPAIMWASSPATTPRIRWKSPA